MDFDEMIVDSTSGSVTREESTAIRDQYLKENPLEFLVNLVDLIPQSKNPMYTQAAITILYAISRHTDYIILEENISTFWEHFGSIAVYIFNLSNIPNNLKLFIGSIIAEIVVSVFNIDPQNTQIQEFLIQLVTENDSKNINQYVIYSISEILDTSNKYCNFPPETLLELMDKETLTVTPKIKLYFAMASLVDPNEENPLHEMFPTILSIIEQSPSELPDIFPIISTFAEKYSLFFTQHIEIFPSFISQITTNTSDEKVQMFGIYILAGIAECAPALCSKNNFYFEPTFDTYVRVISQATDENAFDVDPNDTSPCVVARNTFSIITKACYNNVAFEYFYRILQNVFSESSVDLQYGVFMALSDSSPLFITNLEEQSKDGDFDIIECVMSIINDGDTDPKLRYAAYCVINVTMFLLTRNFETLFSDDGVLETLLTNIGLETEPVCVLACTRAIQMIFKSSVCWSDLINTQTDCQSYIERLHEYMCSADTEDLFLALLETIGLFAGLIAPDAEKFTQIYEILDEVIESDSCTENMLAKAIFVFSNSLSYKTKPILQENPEIVPDYFTRSLELVESQTLSPTIVNSVRSAQNKLIYFIGSDYLDRVQPLLEMSLKTISEIPEVSTAETVDDLYLSCFYYIPNSPLGRKKFIDKEVITSYESAINVITSCTDQKEWFRQFCDSFTPPLIEHFKCEYLIEPIRIACIHVMTNILRVLADTPEDFVETFNVYFPLLVQQVELPYKEELYYDIVLGIIGALKRITKQKIEGISTETICLALPALLTVKEKMDAKLIQIQDLQERFEVVDDTLPSVASLFSTVERTSDAYELLAAIVSSETIQFLREKAMPGVVEGLENQWLKKQSIMYISKLIAMCRSEEVFNEFWPVFQPYFDQVEERNEDFHNEVDVTWYIDEFFSFIEGFCDFFYTTPVSEEIAVGITTRILDILQLDLLVEEVSYLLADNMIILASIIFCRDSKYFNDIEVFTRWFEHLPISAEHKYAHFACKYLVSGIYRYYSTYFAEDESNLGNAFKYLMTFFCGSKMKKEEEEDIMLKIVQVFSTNHELYANLLQFLQSERTEMSYLYITELPGLYEFITILNQTHEKLQKENEKRQQMMQQQEENGE